MKTKIEIKSIFGKVLFTYESENETIKEAVEDAVSKKVSLRSADLRFADLRSADLRFADLHSADLRSANLSSADLHSANLRSADLSSANLSSADLHSANLRFADLSSADLRSADLRSADLRSADLHSADLRFADLRSADLRFALNKENANIPIFCKWTHSIKGEKIQIGCKEKTIEDWDYFFASDEIFETERNSQDFKQIQAVFEAYKAYAKFLNN